MFDRMTIRFRILSTVVALLVMMIIITAVAYVELRSIQRHAAEMQQESLPALNLSAGLLDSWTNEQAIVRELALHDDPAVIGDLEAQLSSVARSTDMLVKRYGEGARPGQDRSNFAAATALLAQFRTMEESILTDLRSGRKEQAKLAVIRDLAPLSKKVQASLRLLTENDRKAIDGAFDRVLGEVIYDELAMIMILVVALILATISGYLLLRAVTGPLNRLTSLVNDVGRGNFSGRIENIRSDEFGALGTGFNRMIDDLTGLISDLQKSSIQVNTSITEVAATSKQQQTTASEIASTTTEIGATSREIATTSRELVRTMEEVSSVAEQTAGLAGSGQAGLSHMNEMMREVVEAASAINAKLGLLNEKATNVTQVVTTITKVADQTNLLSLNASIEAEKAGEYGRGFAVVAAEIRRLADQTAVATYDIEQMVKDIQSAVSAGVVGMDKFSETVRVGMRDVSEVGGQLSQIVSQVQGLVPHFEIVNEGMQAQATGAVQISEALGQLGEVATQTVESLRQSNLAVDSLKDVSNGLRESVSRFRLQTA
jgi:methyl-accepting chemotaxis protein WspA